MARSRPPGTGWYVLGLVIAASVLAAAVVWVGVRVLLIKSDVDAIQSLSAELVDAAHAQDLDRLRAVNAELGAHAHHAAALSADPLWRAGEAVPLVGRNLAAVHTAMSAAGAVSSEVVDPLLGLADDLTDARGGAALSAAVAPGGALDRAAQALHGAAGELDAIEATGLIAPVASGVRQLDDLVGHADRTLQPLAGSARVLPLALGAEGPRTLLLMVQNPAELRTGGGITGTFVQLRAENGTVRLQRMRDSGDFPYRTRPILPIPTSLSALYGDVVGRFVQDASIPADFSLTGRLASAWWVGHGGATPDAVISIDPIVLRSLLAATGPVPLGDGSELSADNLVQRLLVDPYLHMTSEQQGDFFAHATGVIVTRLFTDGVSPMQWASALAQPIADGRVSVWSADEQVQQGLSDGPLGGPLARQERTGPGAYAVYFNDNTGGKMATDMRTAIVAGQAVCRADGKHTVQIAVSLTSTADPDAGRLPISMTGGGLWGVGAGDIGMNVTVAAPVGAFFDGVEVDGKRARSVDVDVDGHPSSITHVNLQPGETNVLTYRFVVDRHTALRIVHTPMITDPAVSIAALRCG